MILGIFSCDFTRTAGSKHKISKMNFDMWNLELTRKNVELVSEKFDFPELKLFFTFYNSVQFSSVQFSVHLNCSKVQQFRTTRPCAWGGDLVSNPVWVMWLAHLHLLMFPSNLQESRSAVQETTWCIEIKGRNAKWFKWQFAKQCCRLAIN